MVQKSLLNLIRKAVRFLLCPAEPLLGNAHNVFRDEPDSPSSTRAIYGSLPSPNYRPSFYLHRNDPIRPTYYTSPTKKSLTNDQTLVPNIKESMKSADSAKEPGSLDKTNPDTYLRRPTGDLETRSNCRKHQNLMDWPEVGDGYIKKIAVTSLMSLQSAKNHLMALHNELNTRFHQWMHRSIRDDLEARHQDTIPADIPAHHPEPAPESQHCIIRPKPSRQLERPPFSRAETQAIAAAQPPAWHVVIMRNVLQVVMVAWMGRLAPGRHRGWAVEALRWLFRHL
jgi:hypothetical protein